MITREHLLRNERFWTETIQNKIYNDLASYIKTEKISQKEIANRLGVSKGRISQILNGSNLNFRIDTLVKICLAINKVPNFKFEDIKSFIELDTKSNYISCVYNQEHIELSELNNTISFVKSKKEGKLIRLKKELDKETFESYKNCITSKVAI